MGGNPILIWILRKSFPGKNDFLGTSSMDSLGNNPGILMKSLVLIGDVCFGFKKKKQEKFKMCTGRSFPGILGWEEPIGGKIGNS